MAKKKVAVIVESIKEEKKTLWQKIKDWFYHSESVVLAWVTGAAGSVTAITSGVLASTDFGSIKDMIQSGTSFRKEQLMVMGAGALAMGALQFWLRVRGTKEVEGRLLPKAD